MEVQITAEITTFVTMTINVPSTDTDVMYNAMHDSIDTYGIDNNEAVIESHTTDKEIQAYAKIDSVSDLPIFEDLEIIDVAGLDLEYANTFSKDWAVQYADGTIIHCDTEDDACILQQKHRVLYGKNPVTGE